MQGQATRRTQLRGVAIVCCYVFFVYLGNSLWLSLFPNYLFRQGMDSLLIGITLTAYNASLSLAFLPSGRLSDRLGRRPPILAGSSLIALSIFWLGLANGAEIAVLAVIGAGTGLALLVPSGNALVSDLASGRGSGSVFAMYQISTLSAAVVGSFMAGELAENIGFSRMFLAGGCIVGVTAMLGYVLIPESVTGKAGGYTSALGESLRSSASGTARMLRSNTELALLTIGLMIHALGYSIMSPFISLFAEKSVRLDIAQVGIVISVLNAALAVAQIPSGHLTDRFGAKPLLLGHFMLSSISWVIYTSSWNFESGILVMIFFGFVAAMDMPARRTIMIEYATADAGKATIIGSLDAITGMMGIVGPLIGGLIWAQMSYAAPFQLAGIVNALACLPLIVVMRTRARNDSTHSVTEASSK